MGTKLALSPLLREDKADMKIKIIEQIEVAGRGTLFTAEASPEVIEKIVIGDTFTYNHLVHEVREIEWLRGGFLDKGVRNKVALLTKVVGNDNVCTCPCHLQKGILHCIPCCSGVQCRECGSYIYRPKMPHFCKGKLKNVVVGE